jgi:transposase
MMAFAGGRAQADYMARVRGIPPEQCLVVPIDVGKHSAVSLVADHEGRVVHDPITFPMTATGTRTLVSAAGAAERATTAGSVRFGIEAAGHYHRVLASTLHASGLDVVELNPAAVKLARSQLGQARVKTDVRDCLAMVELLVRGQGWPLHRHDDQVALQAMWVAQRRRKLDAVQALTNQVHALADLAFPAIAATFKTGFDSPTLRMLLSTITGPDELAAMDVEQLVAHAATHGRRMLRPKARQVVAAAQDALRLPDGQQPTAQCLLAREIAALEQLRNEIRYCDEQLAAILPSTPAGVLASVPGIGVATASYYGAALGDPWRFTNADAAYRYSGLSPSSYDSAGRHHAKTQISRQGAVELRRAMITLGTSMGLSHPDFVAYRRRLLAAGKKPMVVAVALGHRSHRLAFAMMRSQIPYDDQRWTAAVAKGRSVKATEATATT